MNDESYVIFYFQNDLLVKNPFLDESFTINLGVTNPPLVEPEIKR